MSTYTIDRSTWLRGEGGNFSLLFRSRDEKLCCWGQICKSYGIADEDMADKMTPNKISLSIMLEKTELIMLAFNEEGQKQMMEDGENSWHFSKLLQNTMNINDNKNISDDIREQSIIAEFQEAGHTLIFIN